MLTRPTVATASRAAVGQAAASAAASDVPSCRVARRSFGHSAAHGRSNDWARGASGCVAAAPPWLPQDVWAAAASEGLRTLQAVAAPLHVRSRGRSEVGGGFRGAGANGGAGGFVGRDRHYAANVIVVRRTIGEVIQDGVVWSEASEDEAQRIQRLVSSLCGVSAGIGLVCLAAAYLDWWQASLEAEHSRRATGAAAAVDIRTPGAVVAGGSAAGAARLASFAAAGDFGAGAAAPPLDVLARNLVRKNTRFAIEEAYTFVDAAPLGVGSFGEVYRAVHKRSGIQRAVKRVDRLLGSEAVAVPGGASVPYAALNEVEALRLVDHPNICRLVEYFEDGPYLWLVLELCDGEELCSLLLNQPRGLPEAEVSRLMAQMLRAVNHCHSLQLVHRDLKPENFLFQGDELKLIDFGFATYGVDEARRHMQPPPRQRGIGAHAANAAGAGSAGTLMYKSPQMLRGQAAAASDDVWSLGIIFYILLTGQFPFSTNDDVRFQELHDRGLLERDVQAALRALSASQGAADLAARLLTLDPVKRITAEGALQHPFIAAGVAASQTQAFHQRLADFTRTPQLLRLAAAAATRLHIARPCVAGEQDSARAAFVALEAAGSGCHSVEGADASVRPLASGSGGALGRTAAAQGGGVSYTTFMAAALGDAALADARLARTLFDLLDADRDGAISARDLHRRLGGELSLESCRGAIEEALAEACEDTQAPGIEVAAFARLLGAAAVPASSSPLPSLWNRLGGADVAAARLRAWWQGGQQQLHSAGAAAH